MDTGVKTDTSSRFSEESDFNKTIANRLQARRKGLRFKQEEVADAIGITKNHISALERGVNKMNLITFVEWCNALRANPLDILGEYAKFRGADNESSLFYPTVYVSERPDKSLLDMQPDNPSEEEKEAERLSLLKQVMSLPSDERKMALKMYAGN